MIRLNYLLFLSGLLVSVNLKAQEKICLDDNPEFCAVGIEAGAIAPFAGQLLTPKLAIQLGQKADTCDQRLDLELKREKEIHRIEIDYQTDLHNIDKNSWKSQESLLLKELRKEKVRKFFSHPAFVSILSSGLTILFIYGSYKVYEGISE